MNLQDFANALLPLVVARIPDVWLLASIIFTCGMIVVLLCLFHYPPKDDRLKLTMRVVALALMVGFFTDAALSNPAELRKREEAMHMAKILMSDSIRVELNIFDAEGKKVLNDHDDIIFVSDHGEKYRYDGPVAIALLKKRMELLGEPKIVCVGGFRTVPMEQIVSMVKM